MTTAMIFASMLLMGFSCSMGCGSVSSSFILGTQIGGQGSVRSCVKAVALFSVGKIIALALMGCLSATFGSIVLNVVEEIYPNSTVWVVRVVTCLFGIFVVLSAVRGGGTAPTQTCPSSACASCPSMCKPKESGKAKRFAARGSYLFAGFLYAIIPCGPLITTLTYASTMSPLLGTLLLTLFGIVNSIVPVGIYAPVIGRANTELGKVTPYLMRPLKVFGGGLLLYVGLFVA